jgi:crossover junction endodeoxyribonuclease RuvC
MKVLAIDPGSVCAGYALCEMQGRKMHLISSGVLRFNKKEDFLDRIKFIYEETFSLMKILKPDEVALEGLIYVKSPTSLMKLAQARGAMLAAITQFDRPVMEYAPTAIKSIVSGHGGTDKEGLQKLLRLHLGPVEFATHDESDAVAIAICHLVSRSGIGAFKPQKSAAKKGRGLAASLAHKMKESNL